MNSRLTAMHDAPRRTTSADAWVLAGKTCLLVDTDPYLVAVAKTAFTTVGVTTLLVGSGGNGLRTLTCGTWDIVLIDLDTQPVDAMALAAAAASLRPIPAILLTRQSLAPSLIDLRDVEAAIVPRAQLVKSLLPWVSAAVSGTANGAKPLDEQGSASSGATAHARLSPRESEVLALLVRGQAPKDIAVELRLSHATVRTHACNAYRKLGVTNLRELFAVSVETHPTPMPPRTSTRPDFEAPGGGTVPGDAIGSTSGSAPA